MIPPDPQNSSLSELSEDITDSETMDRALQESEPGRLLKQRLKLVEDLW